MNSLRTRFALAMLVWVAVGLLLVGLSASALFRRHVEGVFHAELEEHLLELVNLTSFDAAGRPHLLRPLSDPRYGAAGSGYYWQISGDGSDLLRSPSLGQRRLDDRIAHSQGIVHVRRAGPSGAAMLYGLVRARPDGKDTLHYLVATDVRHIDGLVAGFQKDLLLWLAALALVLIAGALVALRLATRPLDRLATRIARVRAGEEARMGSAWPAEIGPLASDLDRLIESREAMVAAARIEAGNLAHGLRTSLAVLTDEAETLADHPSGKTLLAQCTAMARRLDWHLARARAAAGQGVIVETRLPDAMTPLISAMTRLHAGRGITFTAAGPPVRLAIDPDAFAEILSNLLDNAGKWAATGVQATWRADASGISVTVTDDGTGIPAAAADRLLDAGVRLDEQMPGHGLGLAIARDLTVAAHGRLVLAARGDGQPGTCATLILPPA